MLEVLANFIGTTLLSFTGLYSISKITDQNKKLNVKNIILLILIAIITVSLLKIKSTGIYTVVVILVNIIIYKYVFNITIEESIIANGILWLNMFIADLIVAQLFCMFITINTMRTNPIFIIMANVSVCILMLIIVNIKLLLKQYRKFYISSRKNISIINILFLLLLVIGFSLLAYNVIIANRVNSDYIINTIVMIIFMIITFIYIQNKNKFNQLTVEYDNLFSYVQNFEEWIEREQFNRHEYKNQLAVLRYLSKDKKVKEKIDEILQENINLEGDIISKLKDLPRGGIKGLIYYKIIIAQKNNIRLTVDISLKDNNSLGKLSEQKIKDLCKLIGVYFDNAIEAARETRKKQILIEIYELDSIIKFIFSNTFKKNKEIARRNEKGYSTKGNGRGNGLYFASKLISKNNWITQNQKIIDNYYIQEIIIYKKST